jgi:response regulator RpfG family c-di-GMP phosphodiesterase
MNPKILFVDDDVNVLDAIKRSLHKQFAIDTAVGALEGLKRLSADNSYAVIIADMQMPDISGLQFLRKAQELAPHAVSMMLTGNADLKTAMDAVNDGHVFRFLTKPCPPSALAPAIEAGLGQYRLMLAERELLEKTLGGAVKALTEVLSAIEPQTFERSQRLREYLHDFGASINMKISWEWDIAAMLSQIGRITVPRTLEEHIHQGIALTETEERILEQVPELGARLLANIPRLEHVAMIVRYQQKHFDGLGFPADLLAGDEIPMGSRIFKVLMDLIEFEAHCVPIPVALQKMTDRCGWYDLKVLGAASRWRNVQLDGIALLSMEAPSPQICRIDELCADQILAQDIRANNGLLVLKANTKLTSLLVAKLMNLRALHVIDNSTVVYES